MVECLAVDAGAISFEFPQANMLSGATTLSRLLKQGNAAEQRFDPIISRVPYLISPDKGFSYRLRQKE